MNGPLTVAVAGMNATDNPAPGVPVIRALRAAHPRIRIVGLAYDTLDPGNFMGDIVDHVFLLPYPSNGADVLFERIVDIHRRTPIDVLIPTLDAELPAMVKMVDRLGELGIATLLPDARMLAMREKDRLDALNALGVRVPRSLTITDTASIAGIHETLDFPVMVKGRFYDARVAYSAADVHHYFAGLASKWGLPIIIQEYVAGTEFDVVCVGDGEGGLVGSVAMRKMQLTDKGKAWGGVTVRDHQLTEYIAHAMSVLRWRGPCEFEVMRASDDGKLYLIEVNPRFPAWVFLSVGAGRNLPWAVCQLALGHQVEPMPPADPGVMFLRHSMDQILRLEDYEALTVHGELHRKNALTPSYHFAPSAPSPISEVSP